jgi:Flp pilus assembly protein TadG
MEAMAMRSPQFLRFRKDRVGATAIILGLAIPVLIGGVGLAIDLAGVLAAKTKLEMGADAGALAGTMTSTNAIRTDPNNYIADGVAAGEARFTAQIGTIATVSSPVGTVTVTRPNIYTLVGTTTWSATYNTFFGKLFGVTSWPISGISAVTTQIPAPYLNIEIMLDNSPSMEIGATNTDIATLQALTPCSASGAYIPDQNGNWSSPLAQQSYSAYQCTSSGNTYDGGLTCPIPQPSPPYQTPIIFQPNANPSPSCAGLLASVAQSQYSQQQLHNPRQLEPQAGAPCAFACHFDTSKPSGAGNDYYGVARSTIGQANQVTLRFDVVKAAVNTLISTMQTNDNPVIKSLNAGVFTFDHALTQIYPTDGTEAGRAWAAITTAVGGPPTTANGPDTGIQPYSGGNGADTDFPDTMSALASQLTPSGDGTSPGSPRKVLFLVTDGVQDYTDAQGNRTQSAIDPSYCQTFKNMGYAIYVVYTPYYPLMNGYYLDNMTGIVEGSGAGTTTANLQACASSPSNYIAASDSASLTAALQLFFRLAMNPPAHFSE